MGISPNTYRGWSVRYDPKPIPYRDFDWEATHPDYEASYEGPEDGWVGNGLAVQAVSFDELKDRVDEAIEELLS